METGQCRLREFICIGWFSLAPSMDQPFHVDADTFWQESNQSFNGISILLGLLP